MRFRYMVLVGMIVGVSVLAGALGAPKADDGDTAAASPSARPKVIAPLPIEPPAVPRAHVKVANPIDSFIADRWRRAGVRPVRVASDLDYIRRVTLDLIGRIPTFEEVDRYVNARRAGRDEKLVDRLLDSPEYADHWAIYWGDLLLEQYRIDGVENFAFRDYLRSVMKRNMPYDRWVRDMITARGMTRDNPAAVFVLRYRDSLDDLTIATTQVFLGTQLKCAQCHDHPFEAWTQKDFLGMRAFWENTRRRVGRVETVRRNGSETTIRFDKVVSAAAGNGVFLTGQTSPRGGGVDGLADLVTSPDDPYFARVAVNRLWAKMMGRGLVEPVDAFGPGNPPSHPELLDYLAMEFIRQGYDLKHILRMIALSRTYHLSSTGPPTPAKAGDGPFFERMALRRMSAEQLHDSILTATGLRGIDDGVYRPAIEKRYPRPGGSFLGVFGSHDRKTIHPRDREATIPQALELLNGDFLNRAIQVHSSHPLMKWLANGDDAATAFRRLCVQMLTREPTRHELDVALRALRQDGSKQTWSDLQWALVNTREFMFIR